MVTLRARGFTLIELLVVLAIVSTLAMLVAPRYLQRADAAREAVLRENLRIVRESLDKFYGDQGRYPESLDELVAAKYLRSLPMDPVTGSNATWKLTPVPDGYKGAVYDLQSGAPGKGLDGRDYAQW
jgi:general secretion pathway protein G